MRYFVLLGIFAAVAVASLDCTQYCANLANDELSIEFKFVPCSLSLEDVTILHIANDTMDVADNSASTFECGQSGSGTSLQIHVTTDNGIATFSWTYAESDTGLLCDTLLRGASMDSTLELVGLSVSMPGGAVATWPATSISSIAAQCVGVESTESMLCFSNLPGHTTLVNVNDATITKELEWTFATQFTTAANVVIVFDSMLLDTIHSGVRCVHNVGSTMFQLYDSAYNEWAISWTYYTYTSCDELMYALTNGVDDYPARESVAVTIGTNNTYVMVQETNVVRFSDRQIDCDGIEAGFSSDDFDQLDGILLSAERLIVPILECMTISHPGSCVAVFGYFNPNSYPVRIDAHTECNEIVSAHAISEIQLPSVFIPGRHTDIVRVNYPCMYNGNPHVAWKVSTPVASELAHMEEDLSCSDACRLNVEYDIYHCILGFNLSVVSPVLDTTPVVRCARTIPGTVDNCIE